MRDRRSDLILRDRIGGTVVGRIDRLVLDDGNLQIRGWTDLGRFNLFSEAANVEICAPHGIARGARYPFDVSLPGVRYLSWSRDVMAPREVVFLASATARMHGALRLASSLIAFAVVHRADIVSYFLRGDSESGDRLERALLPGDMAAETLPKVACDLFDLSELPHVMRAVDIVVPIYNAHDDVMRCLDCLGRHTDARHRVILIDDASPDPRIAPLLKAFAERRANTLVLRQPRNLGFIAAVNRALGETGGHVVLLNSDAFVPAGWLDRLMAPILEDPDVASVTPMSNDAEIFSVPVICKPHALAPGEAERLDSVAGHLDWRKSMAEAPTGVGFCMAMNRDWINRVPEFDTVFGRGYGEEVDWCRKCAAMGGRHIGLGSLFVEHRGGGSFSAEKAERVQAAGRIISARYPQYDGMVQDFRLADPLIGPRLVLAAAALSAKAIPVYFGHRMTGGAEQWLHERIDESLTRQGGCIVLRGDADAKVALAEIHCRAGVTRGLLALKDVAGLLDQGKPHYFVYSCLVGSADPLGLLKTVLAGLGASDRFEVMFHDFLPLCPSYNLIGGDGRYCRLPRPDICEACYAGLAATSGSRPRTIAEWRSEWHGLLARADRLITFSTDSRNHVQRVWPDLADRIDVVPHLHAHLPDPVAKPDGERLTVGVLGAIGYSKGAEVLWRLAAHTDAGFRLIVIGKLDPAYQHPALTVHGPYRREEIAALAVRYGVGAWLIPSIWPETYCYAMHECLATGLPVMGFDLGAQGEALREAPHGHILPADGAHLPPAELKARIRTLATKAGQANSRDA